MESNDAGPVTLSGATAFIRKGTDGVSHALNHSVSMQIDCSRGELVVTSLVSGRSERLQIEDRLTLFLLQEYDAMMMRTAYADREVTPLFKTPLRRRVQNEPIMPEGFAWCPVCLGCPEASTTCEMCLGDRIMREERWLDD